MSTVPPILCAWSGEAFVPLPRFARVCDREFVIGERYPLEVCEERSTKSHNHEFAWLDEAWKNLPEHLAVNFPTAEHLRHRALIDAGWYHETIVDAGSKAGAVRVAAAFRARDEFLLVFVRGTIVIIREAKSQSKRKMKKDEFQKSKTAIMEVIASMIGVKPEQLARAA